MGMVRELPAPPHADAATECTIGAASTCTIQLHDPLRQVSRLRARGDAAMLRRHDRKRSTASSQSSSDRAVAPPFAAR